MTVCTLITENRLEQSSQHFVREPKCRTSLQNPSFLLLIFSRSPSMRRRLSIRPQCIITSVDVHRPTPLSYMIKSHLTPWGCLISPPLPLSAAPSDASHEVSLAKRRDETPQRRAKAVLPTRSAEVWPLSVPALSQLSHGACSPDCMVSHRVVRLCCLTALCLRFP